MEHIFLYLLDHLSVVTWTLLLTTCFSDRDITFHMLVERRVQIHRKGTDSPSCNGISCIASHFATLELRHWALGYCLLKHLVK